MPSPPSWPWSSAARPGPRSSTCPHCSTSSGCREQRLPSREPSPPSPPPVNRSGAARKEPTDGPQDPLRHHRPAALRHPRLQRRHVSRTPVIDGLAADGVRFERAHPQSVVCMPSRSTIVTGQHPRTHGVWMNGVPLPGDAPSVAEELRRAGYRTALVGKAHFEPYFDPFHSFEENALVHRGDAGTAGRAGASTTSRPAAHGAMGPQHYAGGCSSTTPRRSGCTAGPSTTPPGQRGPRRRHRRPPDEGQPDRPRDLPHRLGRRPDDRLARLASTPTTTGSAG